MLGQTRSLQSGDVTVHEYQAPESSVLVHSTIVEGPTRLVLFDAQLLLPFATELADYIDGLGKPLDRIVISHVHADHWSGLYVLAQRFPGVPIYALPSVRGFIRELGQTILDNRMVSGFGPRMAPSPVAPDRVLYEGTQTIDTVEYEFLAFDEGEAEHQIVVRLPQQGVLLAFDLVASSRHHHFPARPFFDNWVAILRTLEQMTFGTLMAGHGVPVDRTDIGATVEYAEAAKEAYAAYADPAAFAQAMKDRFPERDHGEWLDFAGLLLYQQIYP